MVLRLAIGASVLLAGACSFDESGIGFASDSGLPPSDGPVADARVDNPDAPPGSPDAAPDATVPPDAAVSFRKAIVIGGGTVAEDLTDFPLYVALTDDSDLRDRARTDGSDLAFLAADGTTQLDVDIETWDPDTGTLLAWVRVPTVSAAADTTIYLRYGSPTAQAVDPTGVWQNGFLAVFHLGDSPSGTIIDATGARDGTASGGMNVNNLVRAKLGDGIAFDGNNDVIDFANPYQGGGEHTISAWVSQEVTGDNDALIVLGTGGATDESRFLHSRFFSGGIAVGLYNDDLETDDDIQGAGFVLVHWTYDASGQSRVYVDGTLVEGPHMHDGAADTAGTEGRIGNAPGGTGGFGTNMGFNGVVDEVHLVSIARSAAWIAAEFANQSSPATFYDVGPEQAL